MKKENNILDFVISFKKNNNMKEFLSFLNDKHIEKDFSEVEKYFWNIKKEKEYKIPNFILKEQLRMSKMIDEHKRLSIAAPTSFGKTFVILNKIKKYNNVKIIISPTLSLCNEYFMELRNSNQKISMSPYGKADVYILTPGKLLTAKKIETFKNRKISISVFDEFYEAFSGYRYPIFEEAYLFLTRHSEKLLQITPAPNVKLPNKFELKARFDTELSGTTRKIIKYIRKRKNGEVQYEKFISTEFNSNKTDGFRIKNNIHDKEKIIEKVVFNTINKKNNIIILASKKEMYTRMVELSKKLEPVNNAKILPEIEKYLSETAKHTQLAKCIKKGIAYHNGTMDKMLRLLIEAAFKNQEIKILLANNTITKGVNLSPNVLLILKYPLSVRKYNEEIRKIEVMNAFGRTGRTSDNKVIGNVVIISSQNSKDKDNDHLIKGNKNKIKIDTPIFEDVKKINSFESAYESYIAIKKEIKISERNMKILVNYLKPNSFKEVESLEVFDAIKDIYKINFNKTWENNRRFLINSYIMKTGYSAQIKNTRERVKKVGFLNRNRFAPTHKESFVNKEGKTVFNIKYQEGTFHEDLIAQYSYEQYETVAAFYFAQLLTNAIETMKLSFPETAEAIKNYNNRKEKEENIATKNGWPDAFADYYILKGESEKSKDYLNEIIKKIYY